MFHSTTKPQMGVVIGSAKAGLIAASMLIAPAMAHNNKVSISVIGNQRCITSNGLPNHRTGQFPNSGNPNRISTQNVKLCVTTNPRKGNRARTVRGSVGVGINGVQFRPGTADYYDPGSRRGHSRNRSSGWNLDGLGAAQMLGMDSNNAHVDNRGLYHYHGIANALVRSGKGSLIGWAADGFEIHYIGSKARSGYRLKKGTRPSGPVGKYDGTYVQDWQYVGGSGKLDQCNGGTLNGKFVYFATETFPFLPHCLWGRVSRDFSARRGGGNRLSLFRNNQRQGADAGIRRDRRNRRDRLRNASDRRGPPDQAIAACRSRSVGSRCSFTAPRRNQRNTGRCRTVRGGVRACVPARGAFVRP
ncbi:MAG: YHYH protein [Rhizobiaceae bacterium]